MFDLEENPFLESQVAFGQFAFEVIDILAAVGLSESENPKGKEQNSADGYHEADHAFPK